MEGKWAPQIGKENKYQYNGKELDTEFDLNWYHYGFRMYDAAIGRFPSADPIAEDFPHVSSYNYAENSPVAHIDLWGLQKFEFMGIHDPNGVQQSFKAGGMAQVRADKKAFNKGFNNGVAAGAVLVGAGIAAPPLISSAVGSIGLMARSIYGGARAIATRAPGFFKGLFAGSMGERAAAMGADATIQLAATMPATGSDYNFASTLSAGLFPQQYALSGALGGGLGLSITENDQGKWNVSASVNPLGAALGLVAGVGAGKLGDGVESLVKNSNGGVSTQAGSTVNWLSNNKEDAVAAKNTIKSLFSLFGAVTTTVVNESQKQD